MRLTTVGIIATFILAILSAPHAPAAQPLPKVPRIGILWFGSLVGSSPHLEAFGKGCASWATRRDSTSSSRLAMRR